jgi:hypothetical protein
MLLVYMLHAIVEEEKMETTKQPTKLEQLGQTLGLNATEVDRAKRSLRNIIALGIVTGVFLALGTILMPGGPVGEYYTGASIKDFGLLFSGWF